MHNLLKDNSETKYFLFDFETCSLNLKQGNFPWQLGFLLCKGTQILEKHAYFIKWQPLPISKGAADATRFNRLKYESEWKEPKEIFDLFETYLYDKEYIPMGHNILGFDCYVHNQWRLLSGKSTDYSWIKRCIDTDTLARGIKNGIKYDGKSDFLAYQYKVGSIIKKGVRTSLTTLGKENGIEFDYANLHDACKDVELNWLIWNKWIKNQIDI